MNLSTSKCAYDVYNTSTTQNRSHNLPSCLQTNIIAQMLSIMGQGGGLTEKNEHNLFYTKTLTVQTVIWYTQFRNVNVCAQELCVVKGHLPLHQGHYHLITLPPKPDQEE